jgi:glycosyltransferase involved in cell wall biosynthesis
MLEAVSDDDTGFVFRSLDPAHLAQRLVEIFAVPGHRARIAEQGLHTVRVRNDWRHLGEESRDCYQRALKVRT